MSIFFFSEEAEAFIASAASRETSVQIMEAIVWFSRSLDEAESLWSGDGIGKIARIPDIIDLVTNNGLRGEPSDYVWGAAGSNWADVD